MAVLESISAGAGASIEVVPPGRGGDLREILGAVELIASHRLAFVSVTDHPAGRAWVEGPRDAASGAAKGAVPGLPPRVEPVAIRTKPGTLGTAVALREAFGIVTVPHIVAMGADRLSTEDLLIDLHYAGFRDVFAVRGDERFAPWAGPAASARAEGGAEPAGVPPSGVAPDGYGHASDLVSHIADLNRGAYTPPAEGGAPTAFTVGVAGYPEKHYEAPNLAADLARLKAKVDAGAAYIVTQMVFDAGAYARFVAALRGLGVTVPVIPGVKPVLRASSIATIPRSFHVDLPEALVSSLEEARSPAGERAAGLAWSVRLCGELLDAGAPLIHFFTMGKGTATREVLDALYGVGGSR
jgi:methylenetetrahydrofolate reductase (NADPH)